MVSMAVSIIPESTSHEMTMDNDGDEVGMTNPYGEDGQ